MRAIVFWLLVRSLYYALLAIFHYKSSTIKGYLSAVRSLHVFEGFSNPLENKPRIQLVLRDLKRLKGNLRRLRCPITPSLLLLFREHLNLQNFDDSMLWACFCIAFFGFLRAGEFTVTPTISSRDCLQVSDVSVDKLPFPSFVRLFIKVAKSDPFRTSCVIVVGRNDSLLCPVEALLRYLHLRGSNPYTLLCLKTVLL